MHFSMQFRQDCRGNSCLPLCIIRISPIVFIMLCLDSCIGNVSGVQPDDAAGGCEEHTGRPCATHACRQLPQSRATAYSQHCFDAVLLTKSTSVFTESPVIWYPSGCSVSNIADCLLYVSATRFKRGLQRVGCAAGNPDDWDRTLYINLNAPMRLTRHFAPGEEQEGYSSLVPVTCFQQAGNATALRHCGSACQCWTTECCKYLSCMTWYTRPSCMYAETKVIARL